MYISPSDLLSRIPEDARVLDLGGWERVFSRADVVADLLPYETRKRSNLYGETERFTKDTWIVADFCSPAFWNKIPDKSFDFITIAHTLEDIRDPLYVCSQMIRCGKAGYIEAPSKPRECAKESATAQFSGYAHHRWIIEPEKDLSGLIFKAKLAWAHSEDYLGDEKRSLLNDYFFQFDGFFWEGSFSYVEHFAKGMEIETADLRWYYDHVVRLGVKRENLISLTPHSVSENNGKCLWVSEYELPSEYAARTGKPPSLYPQYASQGAAI